MLRSEYRRSMPQIRYRGISLHEKSRAGHESRRARQPHQERKFSSKLIASTQEVLTARVRVNNGTVGVCVDELIVELVREVESFKR